MKKIAIIITLILMIGTTPAAAVPFLQLDISDAVYDSSTQTVVATSPAFDLYALIDPGSSFFKSGDTYYVSAAVAPQIHQASSLGSFTFGGTTIDATADMTYGTAPIDAVAKNLDLPSHGIFPTYFTEFSFLIDPTKTATEYNAQDTPGGLDPTGDELYFMDFAVDVSGLNPDYAIHFDLYTKNEDGSINKFAPFSHDAQSAPVPEPATLLLVGTGLLGLVSAGRKKLKK